MKSFVMAAAIVLAGGLVGAQAQTQTETIVAESRLSFAFQVNATAAQSLLPVGWTINPVAAGATKDANITVTLIDRKLALAPDGKPLPTATNRLITVSIPSRETATGTAANVIVGGYSADPNGAPGAYGAYSAARISLSRSEQAGAGLESTIDEGWTVSDARDGASVTARVRFTSALAAPARSETRVYSGVNAGFYRVYRTEQANYVVRSKERGIDRAALAEFKLTGGTLAQAFDGNERLVAITAVPFYSRQTFLP